MVLHRDQSFPSSAPQLEKPWRWPLGLHLQTVSVSLLPPPPRGLGTRGCAHRPAADLP